jgi:hypothetical protein
MYMENRHLPLRHKNCITKNSKNRRNGKNGSGAYAVRFARLTEISFARPFKGE